MTVALNLVGIKFHKLTVIKRTESKAGKSKWLCKCDCGNEKPILGVNLVRGLTKSCGCIKNKSFTGKRFGKLIAIRVVGKKKKEHVWLCKCDCGNTKKVRTACLSSGSTKSCGCLASPDLSGQKFGVLTVIEKINKKRQKKSPNIWLCECSCGNKKNINTSFLKSKKHKSCGNNCNHRTSIAPIKKVYSTYKSVAKKYSREFLLSLNDFIEITKKPCSYCGDIGVDKAKPLQNFIKFRRSKNKVIKNTLNIKKLHYIANGIDRIDSSKGYTKDNSTSCCRPCNIAKSNRTVSDFIEHAKKIANYNKKEGK